MFEVPQNTRARTHTQTVAAQTTRGGSLGRVLKKRKHLHQCALGRAREDGRAARPLRVINAKAAERLGLNLDAVCINVTPISGAFNSFTANEGVI